MASISISNGEAGSSVRAKLNTLFDKARNGIYVWDYMSSTQRSNAAAWSAGNDCTAAINSAIADLPSTGGYLVMPLGRIYTQGGHTINVPCQIVGYGKCISTQPNEPTAGMGVVESGVDGATVFTFGSHGGIRDCSILDTIVATRTSGDAIVATSADLNQRVDCFNNYIFGFFNQINLSVQNSSKVMENDLCGALGVSIIFDNTVNQDAGDGGIINNNIYPGFTGKTAAAAIKVRDGGNKVIGNSVVRNAGNLSQGFVFDIRNGTSQVICIGNKIESVDNEPCVITYTNTPNPPTKANFVIVEGNVFVTSSNTAAALKMTNIGTFCVGGNVFSGGGTNAVDTGGTCASGIFMPNKNNGFTNNIDASATVNGTISYWDANPFFIGGNNSSGVLLSATTGSLLVKTGDGVSPTDITGSAFKVSGATSGAPSDTTVYSKKDYFSNTTGNCIAFNSNGANYGVVGMDSGGDGWYAGASTNGLNGTTTNKAFTWTQNANLVQGSGALATNATNGFLYIESCAGAPTGTPTSYTGRVPIVFDTTNSKIWVFNGTWKGVVVT